ncbi:hypothetical protein PTSG_08028 [Salpingoeca rosetta]|uniref:3-oxo-5-alpha-steroid 4-dehydrogenase C-terminal domain-containing protein n=1 Tax=Salpingoeca rosetta (strain ATCC 50818 / BSB-021) TaxID=946362 RepID=F2UHS9_SALR5|nr:uncharacterized protein PTSG_08028 [Salpingoeca rosetta]EGD76678.1 hypothetical protein PTSG_08028 [Salpingoeca rosetta]|eukprot:XP_004991050.1 hypothetical protein PTSG_08028 [Salpingoeca rosetta]
MDMTQLEVVVGGVFGVACVLVGVLATAWRMRIDAAQPLLAWGKLRHTGNQRPKAAARDGGGNRSVDVLAWLQQLTVPKRWFAHFYVFGLALQLLVFALRGTSAINWMSGLMTVQLARRTWECLFVHRKSASRMHVLHYITGMVFYPLAITLWQIVPATSSLPIIAAALALFILGSTAQALAHIQLRRLADGAKKDGELYPCPRGGMFAYVACPHYTAEVVIYTALAVLAQGRWNVVLCAIFVACNLSLAAMMTHEWYRRHCSSAYSTPHAIIPSVL